MPRDPVDRAIAAVEAADRLDQPVEVIVQSLTLQLAPLSRPAVLMVPIDLTDRELRELIGAIALRVPELLADARAVQAGAPGRSGLIVPGRA